MPRNPIPISDPIEHLSILDAEGRVDEALVPDIADDLLVKLHRTMLLARRFDERLLNLQRQGRVGTFPPIKGQEAAHLGAAALLTPEDWFIPAFREAAAELWRGRSLESVILYYNGFSEGVDIPPERNDLPIAVPVGSQLLHAVGIAWGIHYRGRNNVAMTFFGDGATSEGDFHEALNFAGVFQLPVIFVCQNNHWAISVPRSRQTRSETIAQKALAYGIPGIQVDGNDILAVYLAAQEAVARARLGKGATLIECVTYRMAVHTTADDPTRYRKDEEVAAWQAKDPLPRFQGYLKSRGILDEAALETLEAELAQQIQTAVDQAERTMAQLGDPLEMFDHGLAELPPEIARQRDYLKHYLASRAAAPNPEATHG
ncbi:MAG: pyruvate dehydrogenase (acetyl-transferring) E1 component subunit alpha [Desulfobacterales bacterium]